MRPGPAVSRRRWLTVAAVVFVAAGLVFLGFVAEEEWRRLEELAGSVARQRWDVDPWLLALSLAVASANLAAMATVWVHLYRRSGGEVGYGDGWRIWSATNVGRYIPGKLWHVTGLTVYLRERGESGAAGLVSSLAFQVLVLVTGAASAAAVFLGTPAAPGGVTPLRALAGALLLGALLHPAILRKGTEWAARLTREEVGELERVPGRTLIGAALALCGCWLAYGVSLWLTVEGLLPDVSLGIAGATGVFAASYVVGYLAFLSPGGLLVREGAMVGLLVALGASGAAAAGVLAVAYRLLATAAELLFLAGAFGLHTLRRAR